jgi:CheY-like chemotaxis protein
LPVNVRTVLVVDDDDDIRQLAQMAIEVTAGWNVLVANGGAQALEMARTHHPDAVLLDMMMPGMDGLTTFDAMQADETTRDIPVVLFTAKVQIGEHQAWDDYAVRGTIPKPFDPMTLADQVAQMLSWESVS